MSALRMARASRDALADADLAALRAYTPAYDAERGRARLALATASAGAVGLAASSAGLKSSHAASALAVKGFSLLLSMGTAAAVVLTSREPDPLGHVASVAATACVAEGVGERRANAAHAGARSLAEEPPESSPAPVIMRQGTSGDRKALATAVPSAPPRASARTGRDDAAFERDLRELARLRTLAREDPAALLARAPTTDARFAEEEEVLALRALVATNRREEALTRIDRFLAAHPKSPFAATARTLRASAAAAGE